MFIFIVSSALLISLDLWSKQVAVASLAYGNVVEVIPGFLRFILVQNRGAAFGLFQGMSWLFVLVALIVGLVIFYYISSERCKSRLQLTGFVFIFSGAIGNLVDRVTLGYVVDFIDLPYWPTFNFADIFINVGVVFLLLYLLKQK